MIADEIKLYACGALFLIAFGISFFAGYMTRDSMSKPEDVSYRPEVIQPDGSVILERNPEPASEPAPHQLPNGHVEERRLSIHIQPDPHRKSGETDTKPEKYPAGDNGQLSAVPDKEHPKPIRIDLSLIRDTQGGRRVVASAEGGQIVGGMDIPILPVDIAIRRNLAAGVSYDPFTESPGVWIERDYGRIRVGGDLYQERTGTQTGMAARLRIGWTF